MHILAVFLKAKPGEGMGIFGHGYGLVVKVVVGDVHGYLSVFCYVCNSYQLTVTPNESVRSKDV